MTDHLDELARIAYDAGVLPLDYAESCVVIEIGAMQITGSTREFAAKRILAALLGAGWQMPVPHIPEPDAWEAS
jgi:hypothetical protein